MIRADNLEKKYGREILFDNISFNISKGEKCGLIGRNGSGKTTLLRLLTGQEEIDSGKIIISKDYRLGYLTQHIEFTKETVLEEASLGLPEWDCDATYKVEKVLFGLGFKKGDMERYPSEFSGGYNWRIHLAKVLVSEPDCLILDEPSNFLDIVSLRWLERFLRAWRGESIIISHEREFIDKVSNHIIGIHRKKLHKVKGNCEKFFERILQDEEVYERTRKKLDKQRTHQEDYIRRFGAKATKASQAQSRMKKLAKTPSLDKLTKMHDLDFSFHYASFSGNKVLDVKKLTFAYENEKNIIDNLSFSVESGERIAVVGKNGRGKTTILRLIAGELMPNEGCVHQPSASIKVGYFGQTNINRLNLSLSIEDEISLANPLLTIGEVKGICGQMMFSGDASKKQISVLSGGERSRVLLGKILASSCNLLLLDEPTHHLDIESVEALVNAINEFNGAVIIVTHSELILQKMPLDKLIVCHLHGQDVFHGDYDYFLYKGGWHDDEEPQKKKAKKKISKNNQEQDKKLNQLEKNILQLEAEIDQLQKELSQMEFGDKFIEHSKKLSQKQQKLDELFKEL